MPEEDGLPHHLLVTIFQTEALPSRRPEVREGPEANASSYEIGGFMRFTNHALSLIHI